MPIRLKLAAWLFPAETRNIRGRRWLSIALRSLHLTGVAGVGAAFLYQTPEEQWLPYMMVTVMSGSAMVILEVCSNGIWLMQLRGLSTLLKLMILSLSFIVGLQPSILFAVILLSGLMSHAPGKLRYYSFNQGQH